jgi:hypothetical protein
VSPDLAAGLRVVAEALPAGTAVPVPREFLLELLSADVCKNGQGSAASDRWFTAVQVAELLGMPLVERQGTGKNKGTTRLSAPRWIYSHAAELGGKQLTDRCLRFSEASVRDYLKRKRYLKPGK